MAKKIECELILHGSCKQFSGGIHESKAAAKRWVASCWDRPYTIVPVKQVKK